MLKYNAFVCIYRGIIGFTALCLIDCDIKFEWSLIESKFKKSQERNGSKLHISFGSLEMGRKCLWGWQKSNTGHSCGHNGHHYQYISCVYWKHICQ